jgi:hypothetical protein
VSTICGSPVGRKLADFQDLCRLPAGAALRIGSVQPPGCRQALAALLAAAVLLSAGCSHHPAAPAPAAATGSVRVTHPVPLTAAAARALESKVTSPDPNRVVQAFHVPAGQHLDPAFLKGLTQLRAVRVDESRFVQRDDVSAAVPIVTTDRAGVSTTWQAVLVLVDGGWRIGETERVSS